jgi:hypothetical protein
VADLVKETLASLEARIAELAPLVAEHERLTTAAERLRAVATDGATRTGGSRKRPVGGNGRRRRGGATWKQRFLDSVDQQPGITVGEMASKLKVDSRRLSTLGSQLKKSGNVKKKGRGFYPARRAG